MGLFDSLAKNALGGMLGGIASGEAPRRVTQVEPEQQAERRVVLRKPGTTAYFKASYHAPAFADADFFPLLVGNYTLGGGGFTGLATALFARRLGLSVAVLEAVEVYVGLTAERADRPAFSAEDAANELRRLSARPERLDAGGCEVIDDAGGERRLGADDDEVDRVGAAERDHRRMVGDVERHAGRHPGDARIARRAPQLAQQRAGGDGPAQRPVAQAQPGAVLGDVLGHGLSVGRDRSSTATGRGGGGRSPFGNGRAGGGGGPPRSS